MLSKILLEDAVKCETSSCINCGLYGAHGNELCVGEIAQTALFLMDERDKLKQENEQLRQAIKEIYELSTSAYVRHKCKKALEVGDEP